MTALESALIVLGCFAVAALLISWIYLVCDNTDNPVLQGVLILTPVLTGLWLLIWRESQ